MTEEIIDHIKVNDSCSLYLKSIGSEFKNQVIFIHDVGEYHDRYLRFSEFLISKKIGCTFIDLRGHGLSSGTRGHIESKSQLDDDLQVFWNQKKEAFSDKRTFIIGHGFGAIALINLVLRNHDFAGAILINPSIKYKNSLTLSSEEGLLKYSLLDKIRIPMNYLGDEISKEENLQFDYDHDPLVNKKITFATYKSILTTLENAKQSSYYLNLPILYCIGLEDMVVDIELSELFASSINKEQTTVLKYEDLGHEVFNEIDRDNIFADIYNWIENQN